MVLLAEEIVKKAVRENLIEIQAYEFDKFLIKFIKYIINREDGKIEGELNNYFKDLGLRVEYNRVELSDLEKIDESSPRHTTHFLSTFIK